MTVADLISNIYIAYKGKSSRQPAESSAKYDDAIKIADRQLFSWATDENQQWASLFNAGENVDTVAAGTQTYDLPADFFQAADDLYVVVSATQKIKYKIIPASQRNDYVSGAVYITGVNPQTVTFVETLDADHPAVGGVITIGYYAVPPTVASLGVSDDITVDNPHWLVLATASELARNDPAKDDQANNLIANANEEYRKMVEANQNGSYGNGASAGVAMPSIELNRDY